MVLLCPGGAATSRVPSSSRSGSSIVTADVGHQIGVRGTPAIFSETGELIGGYLPPATLAKVLDDPNAIIEE